jgi:beta-glucosidase
MKNRNLILILITLIVSISSVSAQVYKDPLAAVEDRVNDLLSKMTTEEKIDYIGGYNDFYIRPIDRLGVPQIKMSDGPAGVRNYGKTTAYPAGICMASTWNRELLYQTGQAFGSDARARGVHILLAPGVNINRSTLCGRNFEYSSEDPFLSGKLATEFIKGVQSKKVIATVKHFAGNNQEWDRFNVSSDIDERTLHEIYLPAFELAVKEGNVGSVMNGYNLLNNEYCSHNDYLNNQVLKGKWGFNGFVMSDWGGTHDAIAAANGGLDLEMSRADNINRTNLIPALNNGTVKMSVIDDKVRRILRKLFEFGFFDINQTDSTIPLDNPESSKIALQVAREGFVLLKNKDNLLPLDRTKINNILVVGANANAIPAGGGSSNTSYFHSVNVLNGIKTVYGNAANVNYSAGLSSDYSSLYKNSVFACAKNFVNNADIAQIFATTPEQGLWAEYFDNKTLSGTPKYSGIEKQVNNSWSVYPPILGLPSDNFSVRWTGAITSTISGLYKFVAAGDDGYRLYVDDVLVIDGWKDQGTTVMTTSIALEANTSYKIRLEYYEAGGQADIKFGYSSPIDLSTTELGTFTKNADVVIVCVGFNSTTEQEGHDRPFELPSDQEETLKYVSENNPNTIVVINAGGNVATAAWINNVKGFLHSWYPGQEGGTAVAEILFGLTNPSGKITTSFEKRLEDNPTFNSYHDPNNDKKVEYTEKLMVGYRYYDTKNVEPLFPFGFGLSYSTFVYSNLNISSNIATATVNRQQKVY